MAIPDLVSYIQDQTRDGVSAHVLRQSLIQVGWRDEDIDNALHDVAAGLHPVTAGASLHEDLAQVRGMVSHLAGRVQKIEATLTSTPSSLALPEPSMLPAPQELPRMPSAHSSGDALRLLVSVMIALGGGFYLTLVAGNSSVSQLVGAGVLGFGFLFGALVVMRRHGWLASVLTGASIALFLLMTDSLWRGRGIIEGQTAFALVFLWMVVMVVMERWIRRFERS